MTPFYVPCSTCNGSCHVAVKIANFWDTRRCARCDGLGRQWASGAPAYGCTITLADRDPGEIVTLGTGQQAKILWHMPRRTKKIKPETTFLGLIEDFGDQGNGQPVSYPSCIGVASVDVSRAATDQRAHDERAEDYNDPLQRRANELSFGRAADEPF